MIFKKGDMVVAIKREGYNNTETGKRYRYIEEMRRHATNQTVMTVLRVREEDGFVATNFYNYHYSDLELYQQDLENV